MNKFILKLPVKINKNNGQFSTYIRKNKLPQSVIDEINCQPTALKNLLVEFRGVENG